MASYTDVSTFAQKIWGENIEDRWITRAAEMAYNYINAALNRVYSVPFSTTPGIILDISDLLTRSITEHLINKGRLPRVADIEGEAAIFSPVKMLRMIAEGELDIPGETRLTATGAYLSTEDQMHIFDMDHEFYHYADPDLIESLASDRKDYP